MNSNFKHLFCYQKIFQKVEKISLQFKFSSSDINDVIYFLLFIVFTSVSMLS